MSWQKIDPIPMERVSQFVRQVTHDVRNGLNAIDLQSAYLAEIVPDSEARGEAQRLREMVRDTSKMLQLLSRRVQEPSVEVIDCPADVLVESLQIRMEQQMSDIASAITWKNEAGAAAAIVDVESLTEVMGEVLQNAMQFSSGNPEIRVRIFVEGDRLLLEVTESGSAEPAADPAHWGREPFVTTRRGGFGLGLFMARASLAAQNGDLGHAWHADRGEIVSRISLPLAGS